MSNNTIDNNFNGKERTYNTNGVVVSSSSLIKQKQIEAIHDVSRKIWHSLCDKGKKNELENTPKLCTFNKTSQVENNKQGVSVPINMYSDDVPLVFNNTKVCHSKGAKIAALPYNNHPVIIIKNHQPQRTSSSSSSLPEKPKPQEKPLPISKRPVITIRSQPQRTLLHAETKKKPLITRNVLMHLKNRRDLKRQLAKTTTPNNSRPKKKRQSVKVGATQQEPIDLTTYQISNQQPTSTTTTTTTTVATEQMNKNSATKEEPKDLIQQNDSVTIKEPSDQVIQKPPPSSRKIPPKRLMDLWEVPDLG